MIQAAFEFWKLQSETHTLFLRNSSLLFEFLCFDKKFFNILWNFSQMGHIAVFIGFIWRMKPNRILWVMCFWRKRLRRLLLLYWLLSIKLIPLFYAIIVIVIATAFIYYHLIFFIIQNPNLFLKRHINLLHVLPKTLLLLIQTCVEFSFYIRKQFLLRSLVIFDLFW